MSETTKETKVCEKCEGSGARPYVEYSSKFPEGRILETWCRVCAGTGRVEVGHE